MYPRSPTRTLLMTVAAVMALAGPMLTGLASPSHAEMPYRTDDLHGDEPAALLMSDDRAMVTFLDRLMIAESGGRDDARNPRSTALGPYQFIEATFLDVARRHFASEVATLQPAQILALRTSRPFARRAAEAFTRDNAATLAAAGVMPSFGNLRLAFLVGAVTAARLLKTDPRTPAITIVGANVVQANPFMAGMGAGDLAAWAHRNLLLGPLARQRVAVSASAGGGASAGVPIAGSGALGSPPQKPRVNVQCNLTLPSCRRWLVLAERKQTRVAAPAPKRQPTRR